MIDGIVGPLPPLANSNVPVQASSMGPLIPAGRPFAGALVHGARQADRIACRLFRLRDADGDRLGDSDHPIERLNGNCDFCLLSCEGRARRREPIMLL